MPHNTDLLLGYKQKDYLLAEIVHKTLHCDYLS